jgi:hypothetical protein
MGVFQFDPLNVQCLCLSPFVSVCLRRVFHVSANFVPGTELSPGDKRDKRGQMGQTGTKRTNRDKKDKRGQKGQTENSTCEEFFCLSIYLVVVPVRRSSVKPSLRGVTRTLSIYGSSSTGT